MLIILLPPGVKLHSLYYVRILYADKNLITRQNTKWFLQFYLCIIYATIGFGFPLKKSSIKFNFKLAMACFNQVS